MAKKKNNTETIKIKRRLIDVFTEWVNLSSDEELNEIKDRLDEILDEWNSEDRFGTEGQCDPRGDSRNVDKCPKI